MRKRLLNIESPSARDLQIGREILKFPFAHAENFNTRAQFFNLKAGQKRGGSEVMLYPTHLYLFVRFDFFFYPPHGVAVD